MLPDCDDDEPAFDFFVRAGFGGEIRTLFLVLIPFACLVVGSGWRTFFLRGQASNSPWCGDGAQSPFPCDLHNLNFIFGGSIFPSSFPFCFFSSKYPTLGSLKVGGDWF